MNVADNPRLGWVPDAAGVLCVVAAAIAVLAPALHHGASFGSYDLLSQYGLTANSHVVVHNGATADQVDEIIPWATLAWDQVHHGHLPLWNPYSLLGLPLAFNWQSSAFSLPSLLGYLAPLRLAYTVQVGVTLVIAGTGAYVFARVLRLGCLAATLVGVVFELSGPMMAWLGWPITVVMAWFGWMCAAALMVSRGRNQVRWVAFLALVIAASIYAGQPDTLVVLLLAFAVFVTVLLVLRIHRLGGKGTILRPFLALVVGTVAGFALAAPLLLPGLQLLSESVRSKSGQGAVLPVRDVLHFLFATFDGPATYGYYGVSAAYVGVIALVLAVTGSAVSRRNREVLAVLGVIAVGTVIVFVPAMTSSLDRFPDLRTVKWARFLMPIVLGLSVLAGVGVDALVRSQCRRTVRRWLGGGFAVAAIALLTLWMTDRDGTSGRVASARATSFFWAAVGTALGLLVVAGLIWSARREAPRASAADPDGRAVGRGGRTELIGAVVLILAETVFLVATGAPPLSSSPQSFVATPEVQDLQSAVGSSAVGFGTGSCANFLVPQVGVLQDANDAFGIQEFAAYDPLMPASYATSWGAVAGSSGFLSPSVFCPKVGSASLARAYGVEFILQLRGEPAPAGGVFDRTIGNEVLYRVPDSAAATLTPAPTARALPSASAPGRTVPVTHAGPAEWGLVTDARTPQVLRLHLTNVPGWRATLDGRPLVLHPLLQVMLQARIPPGRHVIELHYWPAAFSLGILLAVVTLLGLGFTVALVEYRNRRQSSAGTSPSLPAGGSDREPSKRNGR